MIADRIEPMAALRAPLDGAKVLLSSRKFLLLAATPVAVTAFAYLVLVFLAAIYADDVVARFWPQPTGSLAVLWYLAVVLMFVAELLVLRSTFFAFVGLIAGPLYEKLALAVLVSRGAKTVESGFVAGLVSTMFRVAVLVIPSVGFGVLGLIPGVGTFVFLPVSFFLTSLAFAAEVLDPTLGLLGVPGRERLAYVRRNALPCFLLGAGLSLSLYVPFLVVITIPGAVVGAASLLYRE